MEFDFDNLNHITGFCKCEQNNEPINFIVPIKEMDINTEKNRIRLLKNKKYGI